MDRKEVGDALYRQKFETLKLDEHFEFLGRDWTTDHGRRFTCRCRSCSTIFTSWGEVLRGRQEYLRCPACGRSSNGKDRWIGSEISRQAMDYYRVGHSLQETADRFGTNVGQIQNAARKYRVSNGRTANDYRECIVPRLSHPVQRAKYYKVPYELGITLKKLIARDGLRCAICGTDCDPSDRSWNGWSGALSPSIDHIVPLAKGGGHVWSNVQIAHAICNSIKGDRMEVRDE